MSDAPQLVLEELLFPRISVSTNTKHDPQGNRSGTLLKFGHHVQKLEGTTDRYALMIEVGSDDANSQNPPYAFAIEVYSVFVVTQAADDEAARRFLVDNGMPVVMSALREHLAQVTARSPWGRFLVNVIALPAPTTLSYF